MAYMPNWNNMPSTNRIEEVMEKKAEKGDVEAAKALAMLRMVFTTDRIAQELASLGMAGASTQMGAIECLSKELKDTGESMSRSLDLVAAAMRVNKA